MKRISIFIYALSVFLSLHANAQTLLNYVPQVGVATTATSGACGPNTLTTLSGSNAPITSPYCGGTELLNNGSSQIPTIAEAGSSGFPSGWYTTLCNIGAGTQTLTPSAGTVGGTSTYALAAGTATSPKCVTLVSDGVSNYAVIPAGGNGSNTVTAGTNLTSSGTCSGSSLSCTINNANGAALSSGNIAAPGTGSASGGTMLGLGGTCHVTPTKTGRVMFFIYGVFTNGTGTSGTTQGQIQFGTGTAPTNGASLTGTAIGAAPSVTNSASYQELSLVAGSFNLTVNTAYWFDLAVYVGAGSTTFNNFGCSAMEF